jgi:hypothetical protein
VKLVIVPPALGELHDAAAFYNQIGSDELRVIAVAHHRRRPGYWADRK